MIIYRLSLYEFSTLYKSYMDKNHTYVFHNSHIYINCLYLLSKQPYYYNSPFIYRNIENREDFNALISNGLERKPISYKHNFVGSHYNPNIPYGNVINTTYIPKNINAIYSINNEFQIEYIDSIHQIDKYKLDFSIGIPISISLEYKNTIVSKSRETIPIEFIIDNLYQSRYFIHIRWKPLHSHRVYIGIEDLVTIDLSQIIGNSTIDKYNNVEIYYSIH